MRLRTLLLFAIALLLAGGTAILVRSWLAQRPAVAAAAPPPPPAQKSVLVARDAITRGQILKPTDVAARPWPEADISGEYILAGSGAEKSLVGSVARQPFVAGEPIVKTKIVAPGERGFLAAVLRPGMRAVSVPVDATSEVSGFVFPGDRVDLLITLPVPQDSAGASGYQHKAAETVLRDLRVIAIDQRLGSKDGQAVLARTVTFEVTPKQSEIVALAGEMGKLSLSLRSLVATPQPKPALVSLADSGGDAAVDSMADAALPSSADSVRGRSSAGFTLDSDVSPLLPKPFSEKQNPGDGMVTILRGNGNNGTSVSSQPASRGS
jgi:pilus assembly protein CpaB